jgi:hypothetical protein
MKEGIRKVMKAGSFKEEAIIEQKNLSIPARRRRTCSMVLVAFTMGN